MTIVNSNDVTGYVCVEFKFTPVTKHFLKLNNTEQAIGRYSLVLNEPEKLFVFKKRLLPCQSENGFTF